MKTEVPSIYDRLGVRPIINGVGAITKLGGSIPPPAVARAIEEASSRYVVMSDLLEQSGRYIANLLGVEAAYVTSGAAAGLSPNPPKDGLRKAEGGVRELQGK